MNNYKILGYDIKDLQNEMLKIMCAIDKVCRENNIHYILDSGTMLGAVRHQGFIPWDDDADIIMLRDDYEKFIDIANRQLPPEFRFECLENTKEYPYNFGKVRAVNTLFRENFTKNTKGINHGIYIDIFPMDYVEEKNFLKHAKWVGHFTGLRYDKLGLRGKKRKNLTAVVPLKLINTMAKKIMKYHYLKGDKVCKLCHYGPNKPIIDKSLFTDVIEVPFEGEMFFIPKQYDSFLKGRYGDYMQLPPIEKQKPCHEICELKIPQKGNNNG